MPIFSTPPFPLTQVESVRIERTEHHKKTPLQLQLNVGKSNDGAPQGPGPTPIILVLPPWGGTTVCVENSVKVGTQKNSRRS
jgi:hypothetical protein